jgi:hypothetical protein
VGAQLVFSLKAMQVFLMSSAVNVSFGVLLLCVLLNPKSCLAIMSDESLAHFGYWQARIPILWGHDFITLTFSYDVPLLL